MGVLDARVSRLGCLAGLARAPLGERGELEGEHEPQQHVGVGRHQADDQRRARVDSAQLSARETEKETVLVL